MAPTAKDFNSNNRISLTPAGESKEESLEFVELMTKNCDAVQQQVLAEILEQNKDTEYLCRHGLGGATDRTSFKSKIPVVTYDDLKPYIQRIADGDRSPILFQQPISEFLTSSGTSGGERKLMPTTQEEQDRRLILYKLAASTIRKAFPKVDRGKALFFFFVKSETKTPGGIIARPALTSYFKSPQFQAQFDSPSSIFTSPLAAILCPDIHQSTYIQLLCGLYHRLQVLSAGSITASGFLRIIHFLQTHWQQLVADIAAGVLSPSITDPSLGASVANILRPDPDLARFVADECSKSDWAGIITRIWPNTEYLNLNITGSMAQYVPSLQFYSGGGLPLVTKSYASSECYFGINLNPLCRPSEILYTLFPNFGYFEFAPVDGGEGELVDLADVKIGRDYELVVTTYAGLYRYRVGDVLRVGGFHNSAPQIQFLRRKSVVLSIDSDKTDETELQRAVERAAEVLEPIGVSVAEYTSHACTETIPGHYIIYWELLQRQIGEGGGLSKELGGEVMDKCCLEMEEALNSVYRQCRVAERSIGPLEIRVVQSGTFDELMDYALSTGASFTQYKVSRCVSSKPVLELLNSRVVSAHFSKVLPRWNPNRFELKDKI